MSIQQVQASVDPSRSFIFIFNSIFEPYPIRIFLLYRFYWECCRSCPDQPFSRLVNPFHFFNLICASWDFLASKKTYPSLPSNTCALLASNLPRLPKIRHPRWWRFWKSAWNNRGVNHGSEWPKKPQWFIGTNLFTALGWGNLRRFFYLMTSWIVRYQGKDNWHWHQTPSRKTSPNNSSTVWSTTIAIRFDCQQISQTMSSSVYSYPDILSNEEYWLCCNPPPGAIDFSPVSSSPIRWKSTNRRIVPEENAAQPASMHQMRAL